MSELKDAREIVRDELMPVMDKLCELVREQGMADQEAFFERIRSGLSHVREPEDLVLVNDAVLVKFFEGALPENYPQQRQAFQLLRRGLFEAFDETVQVNP